MHRAPVYDRLTGSIRVCIEQPFTQVMLGAPKYARSTEQPFVLPFCYHRRRLGSTVYSLMLRASKYAPKYAPNNRRLLSHARSTEVNTEQMYTRSYSEHRRLHGATVYLVVLGASKYARSNHLLRCMHG